ncbi:hypothetical protein [Sporomusa sphaeroides]|uniref:hypothetical protein n=1 Tax=Sporomusa sphaeroides TaxID=47679 RepID=UPI003D7C2D2D
MLAGTLLRIPIPLPGAAARIIIGRTAIIILKLRILLSLWPVIRPRSRIRLLALLPRLLHRSLWPLRWTLLLVIEAGSVLLLLVIGTRSVLLLLIIIARSILLLLITKARPVLLLLIIEARSVLLLLVIITRSVLLLLVIITRSVLLLLAIGTRSVLRLLAIDTRSALRLIAADRSVLLLPTLIRPVGRLVRMSSRYGISGCRLRYPLFSRCGRLG